MTEAPAESGGSGDRRPLVLAIFAAITLAALFVGGYELYTHIGARLFAQTHAGQVVPAPLLLMLAIIGGGASFFSPCSLAITPSFLTYFLGANSAAGADDRRSLLGASSLVALGIVLFYAVAGALVSTIGAVVYEFLIYLIPLVALGFLGLGLLILTGRGGLLDGLGQINPVQRYFDTRAETLGSASRPALVTYGAAYGAAAHTCTLPIFLGIVLLPLGAGNYVLAGFAVLLYGVAIAALLLIMAYLGQSVLLQIRRFIGRRLQQLTGGLFLLTSAYLLHYFWINYGFLPWFK